MNKTAADPVLQATIRADQDPAHAEPRRGRMEARRGDPLGAGARGALPREPGDGAQGDRRARLRAHPDAPPGQGHLRRLAQRAVVPVPLPARDARLAARSCIRRTCSSDSSAARRSGDAARALRTEGRRAGASRFKRVMSFAGRPMILDEIVLAAQPLSRASRSRSSRSSRGSIYSFYETVFGVRMIRAEERLRAVAADGVRRGAPARSRRARRCCASIASPSPTATSRSNGAGACAVTDGFSYFNELS